MEDQLKMSFDPSDTVRRNLREGRFTVLVEYRPPAAAEPLKLAMKPGLELAEYVNQDERVAALAVTDTYADRTPHPMVDVVRMIGERCDKQIIAYVAGRRLTGTGLRERLAQLTSLGVSTVAAVTGQAGEEHPRDAKGLPKLDAEGYLDSCRQLQIMREGHPDLFVGATVNPFKYNLADTYLQYYKMMRKLNLGAEFMVSQAGWDMRKYQELQWYLQSRGVNEPFVARLWLLRPAEVDAILDHRRGGVVMSRELGALLQRESQLNEVQALTAQIRRLALQAAGCRFLGYSGIQIAGLEDARTARTVVDRVHEAMEEFTTYDSWVECWQDFHSRVELAPYPYRYYAFKGLLEKGAPNFDPEATTHPSFAISAPGVIDKLRSSLARICRAERRDGGWLSSFGRRVFAGSRGERSWRIEKTAYLSAASCPKGIEDGACGGTHPDGTCELGHRPCFYHRVLSLADWRNDLDLLERVHDDR